MHNNTAGLIETLSHIADTREDHTLLRLFDAYYMYMVSMVGVALKQLEDGMITEAKETLLDLQLVDAGFVYDIDENGKKDGITDV